MSGTIPTSDSQSNCGDDVLDTCLTGSNVDLKENAGHTFLVRRVSEDRSVHEQNKILIAVPVMKTPPISLSEKPTCSKFCMDEASPITSQAIVPLSSSLPSKLLRFQARRSAQALLERVQSQPEPQSVQTIPQSKMESLDSQFASDESVSNDCADIFDSPTPTGSSLSPPMSPPPPRSSPIDGYEDKLIDVGMGSSIEGSEESEEDDELKPLAVDNHVLMHDVDLDSPNDRPTFMDELCSPPISSSSGANGSANTNGSSAKTAVLSEANLEKFRKHHHQFHPMENIYLHPNFKYETEEGAKNLIDTIDRPIPEAPVLASPEEPKRVHRSFLTMKKQPSVAEIDVDKASSVFSHTTTISNSEVNGEQSTVNEIDTLDPSLVPSEELAAEIADAVEFYFSNDSILKDAFLLKHVRRNKEGFVSLKLVSSFKRVRQLTKEWKVVGNAVQRKSRKIELNDLGTKVRRIEPMPNFDETMPSRTIVACDLPLDKLTIEKVSDIFTKCGEIALIRILKPGMAVPVDVRQFMNKYPEVQQKECALVEFLESSSAREARNMQGSFEVYEMVAPKKKTGKKAVIQVAAPVARMVENYRYYNDATYERTRGGSFSGIISHDTDLRHKLRRNNSDFPTKALPEIHHQSHGVHHYHHYQQHHPSQQSLHNSNHRGSFSSGEHSSQYQTQHQHQHYHHPRGSIGGHDTATQTPSPSGNNSNFFGYGNRRYSNTSTISTNTAALVDSSTPPNATQNQIANSISTSNGNSSNNVNNSTTPHGLVRRLSNCSDNYGSFSEMCRRSSNCSENTQHRRDSNCSENCPCSRRISDFGQSEVYRKTSQGSISSGDRRFSNGSLQFERTFSHSGELMSSGNGNGNGTGNNHSNTFVRRMSNDFIYERKQSMETQSGLPYDNDGNVGGGGGGYNVFPRRYSNNFTGGNKMAAFDNAQYINGRRISTDSGYDRRYSFGSEYEGSPRSRTGSFLNNYKHGAMNDFDGQPRSRTGSFLDGTPRSRSGSFAQRNAENLVRTPLGPDGSKGFGSRSRKFGQTISPVN